MQIAIIHECVMFSHLFYLVWPSPESLLRLEIGEERTEPGLSIPSLRAKVLFSARLLEAHTSW